MSSVIGISDRISNGATRSGSYSNLADPKLMKVIKREGHTVSYDTSKILRAVSLCLSSVSLPDGVSRDEVCRSVVSQVDTILRMKAYQHSETPDTTPTPIGIEAIQDIVESQLVALNQYDASKHYILYREERRKIRESEANIPSETVQAFQEGFSYFKSDNRLIQEVQALDKFARFDHSKGRRESWVETVDRVMAYYRKHVHSIAPGSIPEEVWADLKHGLLNHEATGSMRGIQMAGPALDRCQTGIFNCLRRNTRFVTNEGVRSFEDFQDGDTAVVLTHLGNWKKAVVHCYGQDDVYAHHIKRGRTHHIVYATKNHQWLLTEGDGTKGLTQRTMDIWVGDKLVKPPTPFFQWDYSIAEPFEKLYWAYGYVFGDGSIVSSGENHVDHSMVRLCGHESSLYLHRFEELGFKSSRPLSAGGDSFVYTGTYLKTAPDLKKDPINLVRAFVRGYMDADAQKIHDSSNINRMPSIQATGQKYIDFIREVFPVVGVYISREEDVSDQVTNFGPRKDVTSRFGLLAGIGNKTNGLFSVTEIEENGILEDVWCLEVEDDHSFVLSNGLVTGNCSFLIMDSPESLAEDLYLLMNGVGVGFSVEEEYAVDKWPRVHAVRDVEPVEHLIGDDTESWCDAVKFGLYHWLDGADVKFDFSQIRPVGSLLRTKGGRASGSGPLRDLLNFSRDTILRRQKKRLRSIDIHDMTCMTHRIGQMGGVRRASGISLSDLNDVLMRDAKRGRFHSEFPWRDQANNSAVYEEKPSSIDFMEEWIALAKSGSGERGIFNRGSLKYQIPERRKLEYMGGNPCLEIFLRKQTFCNLSIAIVNIQDSLLDIIRKVTLATIWGTIQASMTRFRYLRPEWKISTEEDALLGVDILGHMDCLLLKPGAPNRAEILQKLRQVVRDINVIWAKKLGINPGVALTCGKPSGDSSQFFQKPAGLKPHHGKFYVRRFRFSPDNPIAMVLKDAGVPWEKEYNKSGNLVFDFPCQAPPDTIILGDMSAIEQLENWKMWKVNFTEHNPSATLVIKDSEWLEAGNWVYKNWDIVGGLSFFPFDNSVYPQTPYETISEEEYNKRMQTMPTEIDWSRITLYEHEDLTTLSSQLACTGPGCDV